MVTGTSLRPRVYWCPRCQVPLLRGWCEACGSEVAELSPADLRPVFRDELTLIHSETHQRLMRRPHDLSVWASGRNYFRFGARVATLRGPSAEGRLSLHLKRDAQYVNGGRVREHGSFRQRLVRANWSTLRSLETEAIEFIRSTISTHSELLPVVSFSGGKDSGVVSSLTSHALAGGKPLHIFVDTGIESPNTLRHVDSWRNERPSTPFFHVQAHSDFFEQSALIGPPSRFHRWCCTTQKGVPFAQAIERLGVGQGVLTFDGIRAYEARQRSTLARVRDKSHVARQTMASPILHWTDTEVWVYTLVHGLSVNPDYRLGYRRIGCLLCPANSAWSDFLTSVYYPAIYHRWMVHLTEYAHKAGKSDPGTYARSGGWKSRGGGAGAQGAQAELDRKQCLQDSYTRSYRLKRDWSPSFWEYLKPLGLLHFIEDNDLRAVVLLQARGGGELAWIEVVKPDNEVRIEIRATRDRRLLQQRLEIQIRKFQTCTRCGACAAACPNGAITVDPEYHIDEARCTGCLKCLTNIRYGCLSVKSLRRAREESQYAIRA